MSHLESTKVESSHIFLRDTQKRRQEDLESKVHTYNSQDTNEPIPPSSNTRITHHALACEKSEGGVFVQTEVVRQGGGGGLVR